MLLFSAFCFMQSFQLTLLIFRDVAEGVSSSACVLAHLCFYIFALNLELQRVSPKGNVLGR